MQFSNLPIIQKMIKEAGYSLVDVQLSGDGSQDFIVYSKENRRCVVQRCKNRIDLQVEKTNSEDNDPEWSTGVYDAGGIGYAEYAQKVREALAF